jgi:hypothetical protein
MESYLTNLAGLGFTPMPREGVGNVEIYTLESAGETLRVLFVNQGSDVQVTFVEG